MSMRGTWMATIREWLAFGGYSPFVYLGAGVVLVAVCVWRIYQEVE